MTIRNLNSLIPAPRRGALALAVLAAFAVAGPVHAEEGSSAEGSVSVGVGVPSGDAADRAIFGQYNGMRDRSAYGLLGFDYDRRDDKTGLVVQATGTQLLLDTRELALLWKRQGDWRLTARYDELVRRDPYSANTGLLGAGSALPQVQYLSGGAGSGGTYDFETRRKAFGLGLAKWFGSDVELALDLRSERKTGARASGIGMLCPPPSCAGTDPSAQGAILMLPEPIDARHSEVDARLSYANGPLRLTGGYYGSFYRNDNGAMAATLPGTLNNPLNAAIPVSAGLRALLGQPIALAPDNDAHRFDIGGTWAFSPTTRANFKLAQTRATQNQDFAAAGLSGAPAGVGSLNGKVSTLLGQVGISARPQPALTLIAESRYDDKDDKTPLAPYTVEGGWNFTNRVYSQTRWRNKLQASYRFAGTYQATLGVDQESIDRGTYTATSAARGISAWRQDTDELSWRAELRRQMTTSFSGALSVITSKRDGSIWMRPVSTGGVTEVPDPATLGPAAIYSPTLADRKRDKIRLFGNWQALDDLSLQFTVEQGKDAYTTPTSYALRDTRMSLYSLDATYALSEDWSLTGYLSRGGQKLNQARPAGYVLAYDNTSVNLGLGLNGKVSEKLRIGGNLSYADDRSVYAQSLDAGAGLSSAQLLAATGGLPDILFRQTELRLFGRYELSVASALRVDAIYQRVKTTDWGFGYGGVPFLYSDNTTLNQQQLQNVTYLGLSYSYAWR